MSLFENTFTALDFETANADPISICQIGLVRVSHGQMTDKVDLLVRPPDNYYFYKNIEVHGIQPADTLDSPTFDAIWPDIREYIEGQVVVAHNIAFDVNCLRNTLDYYRIDQPDFDERCTRAIYRKGLSFLSKKYRIPLSHHHALSDAMACAELYLKHIARQNLPKTGSLFSEYAIQT